MELYLTMRRRADFPFNMDCTPEDMPVDVALRALDVAAASKSPQILLRGNEPLLHPDLEMVLKGFRKRGIIPVIETSGLMPSMAKRLIREYHCRLIWRLYRPSLYSPEDLEEMKANLKEFSDGTITVRLVVMVDDMSADYGFVREYLDNYEFEANLWRFSCLHDQADFSPVMALISDLMREYIGKNLVPALACGVMPCAMTDAQFGFMAKVGGKYARCIPHLGVLPDGRVCHCQAMRMLPGPHISTFKNEGELHQYYIDVFISLQWQLSFCPECNGCPCLSAGLCTGVSMAKKAHGMLAKYEELKAKLAAEQCELSDEARMKLLWEMSEVCMILGLYPDAIECLEEIRRQAPENGKCHFYLGVCYWETGSLAEGEDEFRKCARLSDNPLPALNELFNRFVKNGNTIRARLLQGEIEKEELKLREAQRKS